MFQSKFHNGPKLDDPPKAGDPSPWGRVDVAERLAPGVVFVSTPSHGGIWCDADALARIPAPARSIDGWYEEDCEAGIPMLYLGLPGSLDEAGLRASIERWNPEALQGGPAA